MIPTWISTSLYKRFWTPLDYIRFGKIVCYHKYGLKILQSIGVGNIFANNLASPEPPSKHLSLIALQVYRIPIHLESF